MNMLLHTLSSAPRIVCFPPLSIVRAAVQGVLVTLALSGCTRSGAPETVWVGHLVPRSGPRQAEGEQARMAFEMALTTLRTNQELFDGRALGVRHVDASRPGQARAETARLLAVNRAVALLVGPGVPGVEEVVAAAHTHETAVIVLDGLPVPPDAGSVVLGAGPAQRGRALATFAREKLK